MLGGSLVQIPLNIDLSSETAARGTGPAQHVYLTDFTLSVTSTDEPAGDTDDLSFISSIEIFVESTQAGTTLPRMRVAHLDAVPAGARTISLQTDGVDLIGYVREGARFAAGPVSGVMMAPGGPRARAVTSRRTTCRTTVTSISSSRSSDA